MAERRGFGWGTAREVRKAGGKEGGREGGREGGMRETVMPGVTRTRSFRLRIKRKRE